MIFIPLIFWALLLFGGFIFGKPTPSNPQRIPRWARLGSSLALVVAAWMQGLPSSSQVFLLIAVGMTLGFIGDIFMARKNTLAAMIVFGLGHLAYTAAFLSLNVNQSFNDGGLWIAAFTGWWLVGMVGWLVTVYLPNRGNMTMLHWAALAYGLLLSSTVGAGTGLTLHAVAFIPLMIGAVLFLLSDTLISLDIFSRRRILLHDDLVWLTYGAAQALIVYWLFIALILTF
jgi:hypothetical protein